MGRQTTTAYLADYMLSVLYQAITVVCLKGTVQLNINFIFLEIGNKPQQGAGPW